MEKKTVVFIIVSVVIMALGMGVLPALFPGPDDTNTVATQGTTQDSAPVAPVTVTEVASTSNEVTTNVDASLVDASKPRDAFIALPLATNPVSQFVTLENELVKATFAVDGARLISVQMKKHLEQNQEGTPAVELLFPSSDGGLVTAFGGIDGQYMTENFAIASINEDAGVVEFYRDYSRNDRPDRTIRVTKKYTLLPNEYVFQFDIGFTLDNNEILPSPTGEFTYSLGLRPQIGPTSSKISNYQDFRKFVYFTGSKKVDVKQGLGVSTVRDSLRWASLTGKYFSFILVPNAAEYEVSFIQAAGTEIQRNELLFSRKTIQSSANIDTFRIYFGPKLSANLAKFDKAEDNAAKLSGMEFTKLIDFDFLGWLSEIMKFLLQVFYNVIPNWGIAIILLTILVKVALFPLSKKSAESSARMQELNPRLMALRDKFKDNPQRLNEETAKLYQSEKINPLSGCLPLLIQLPFFFAMYALFNNHFDLRGASFIPGWINDLSAPESVYNFGSFVIPFVNINDIRLLPIIYVASQILSTFFSPTSSGAQMNGQMKFMMYGMPIMFFFILYNVPSGLLVYWIFQNILSIGQQLLVNYMMQKKKSGKAIIKK